MHPQRQELIEGLGRFMPAGEDAYLVVREPESGSEIRFGASLADRKTGVVRKEVRVRIGAENTERVEAAVRVGLPAPQVREVKLHFGPNRGTILRLNEYNVEVRDPETAADLGLAVMREVFGIEETVWLWITDVYEPDDWPVPLPRPKVWPPVGWNSGSGV